MHVTVLSKEWSSVHKGVADARDRESCLLGIHHMTIVDYITGHVSTASTDKWQLHRLPLVHYITGHVSTASTDKWQLHRLPLIHYIT